MRLTTLLAALLALWPLGALAQGTDFKGLDLTDEPKKADEPKKPDEKPAPPPPTTTTSTAEPGAAPKAPDHLDEVQIANEDRVKSVQRKPFLKKFRLELTPMGFVTVNDSFYPKIGPGGRLSFFFGDSLGLGLRYNQVNVISTDEVRLAKRELQSKLPAVQPKHLFALDVMFVPVYGKISVGNGIGTFDLYIVGGAGGVWSQTSGENANGPGDGIKPAAHIGIGERFALLDWLALDLSVLETLYNDKPLGTKSVIQNLVSINLGVSFFIPFSFEYKEQ
jgi:outer membrane beta-barrel protein